MPQRAAFLSAALFVILILTACIPVLEEKKINEQAAFSNIIHNNIEKIDALQKKIQKIPSEEISKKTAELLKQLTKDMKSAKDINESRKLLQKTQEDLKKLEKDLNEKDLNKLSELLQQNKALNELAKTMLSENEEVFKESLELQIGRAHV